MAALFALSGALLWGLGDFLGGIASRRISVLTVLAVSQAIGLAGLVVWILLASDPFPGRRRPAAGCRGGARGARRARCALPRSLDRRDGHRGADLRGGTGRAAHARPRTGDRALRAPVARHRPRARGHRDALPRAVGGRSSQDRGGSRPRTRGRPRLRRLLRRHRFGGGRERAVGGGRRASHGRRRRVRGRRGHVRTASAPTVARSGPRRRRRVRHGRERVRRVRNDRGHGRNRRDPERALPRRDRRARAPLPATSG